MQMVVHGGNTNGSNGGTYSIMNTSASWGLYGTGGTQNTGGKATNSSGGTGGTNGSFGTGGVAVTTVIGQAWGGSGRWRRILWRRMFIQQCWRRWWLRLYWRSYIRIYGKWSSLRKRICYHFMVI